MALYKAEALVLRVRDFGEADKILTLLRREGGKAQAVAKGARRPRNRLAGVSQVFTHCHLMLFHGRSLDNLSQSEILNSFGALREDLTKMAYASYMAELTDEMVRDHDPHPGVFLLLLTSQHLLAAGAPPEPVLHAFELRLLGELGYRPSLDACVNCGGPLAGAQVRFSPNAGGALCGNCLGADESGTMVSRGAVETMRHLLTSDLARVHLLRLDPAMAGEIATALGRYLAYRLDKRLKTLDFLELMRDNPTFGA
ncbi:MAG: DNA repair protein RecO [Symbiobacteriia bacterium]